MSTSFLLTPAFSSATGMAFQGPIPMSNGGTLTTDAATYLPRIFCPRGSAVLRFMSRTAAAPSEIWEALPAWIDPFFAKAGLLDGRKVILGYDRVEGEGIP